MSSLWKRHFATFNKNNSSPSPKLRKILSPCNISFPEHPVSTAKNIKRISLPMLLKKPVKASMTVETAMVLPLFCFFMIHMGSAIEMIRLHGNLEVALWNAGRQVGIYENLVPGEKSNNDSDKDELNDRLEAGILSYTYIKNRIKTQLGEEYLKQAPLENGIDGLQFLEGKIKDDVYEIVVTYKISPLVQTPGFRNFRMANRYYGHLWNGYEIPGSENTEDYVYVTEDSEVYHTNRNCTHLSLSIRSVEAGAIPDRYKACEKCIGQQKENVVLTDSIYYICPEGECYHSNRDCSGLKRTVYCIPREKAGAYRECSRCRKTGENSGNGNVGKNNSGSVSPMGKLA